jgi:hypothetical protein
MARLPLSDLRARAHRYREFTLWFDPSLHLIPIRASLTDSFAEFIRHMRSSSILRHFLSSSSPLSQSDRQEISANSPSHSAQRFDQALNLTVFQGLVQVILRIYKEPIEFGRGIIEYFSVSPENLGFFARVTFPSIFGYFLGPELMDAGATVIRFLLDGPLCVALPFAIAFFESFPGFLEVLLREYEMGIATLNRPLTPSNVFRFVLKAVTVAVRALRPVHHEIAVIVDSSGTEYFSGVFVRGVLFDTFAACYGTESAVAECIRFCADSTTIPFRILRHAFLWEGCTGVSELAACGGFGGLQLRPLRLAISTWEGRLILNVCSSCHGVCSVILSRCPPIPAGPRPATIFGICPTWPSSQTDDLRIDGLGHFPVFQREDDEFGRVYKALSQLAGEQFCDVLRFFDDSSYSRKLTAIMATSGLFHSEKFRRYCYLKYASLAGEKIAGLDQALSLREAHVAICSTVEFARALGARFHSALEERMKPLPVVPARVDPKGPKQPYLMAAFSSTMYVLGGAASRIKPRLS